ncbi:MAG: 30S ribosomal protein S12 methylthiotransferase RimO [Paludibacteraceae bacterium]|nr:30S ribosomal protein S12 methylthiotransferase RimO [Paludibacteraceae bacterium]MBP9039300.1 30S ribosomal protein S12 methylthiotransferase RimO [Paludibacteraceae bacterium]MDI9536908.1 30S ribosomal protein S12 methylthiotransferase RimO [Bacteroidota bacterium]HPD27075.1 30S ribosomal protein S12 methylthiotransferase RimO [Paludibacteraceae bacterium]HRU72000.1 30S ribosomal protein S12 methylthiotransferase RimO [Paludibacteraceae bacterium]
MGLKLVLIDLITLGCSKNLVDTEKLMYRLNKAGYRVRHDAPRPDGDIVVINTCGFIGDAKEESINIILQFAERKRRGKLQKLFVMGCLSERYLHDLQEEIPEVDKFYGKFNYTELVSDLGRDLSVGSDFERIITTPSHYAYVKIAEGCNRTCSYCAIPIITGHYVSRPMDDIEREVRWLTTQNVKEFQIIAQDLSYYGIDLYKKLMLPELISRLSDIEGVKWIRLHYAYPVQFPYDILKVMRERNNVCKYLDIALQHISDTMLKQMRRNITAEQTKTLLARIREEVPGIHLRTTLLLGHPGEMEQDVEELKRFVVETRFERLGAFSYSDEEGTYANLHYSDHISQEEKQRRVDAIMSIQQQISEEINAQKIGQTLSVIIDREETDYYVGRTEFDSPEVDGEVLIIKEKALAVGEFYPIKITDATEFDLYGKFDLYNKK